MVYSKPMKSTDEGTTITEMEGMVLAIIGRDGALTAYEIKENFRTSPSGFWSGSAGAVYPLVKRLEQRRILVSKDISETRRPRRVFSLTKLGRDLMASWIVDVERAVDPGYDPLRSRLMFISLVTTKERDDFLTALSDRISQTEAPPNSAPQVRSLHALWVLARETWFREFVRVLRD